MAEADDGTVDGCCTDDCGHAGVGFDDVDDDSVVDAKIGNKLFTEYSDLSC